MHAKVSLISSNQGKIKVCPFLSWKWMHQKVETGYVNAPYMCMFICRFHIFKSYLDNWGSFNFNLKGWWVCAQSLPQFPFNEWFATPLDVKSPLFWMVNPWTAGKEFVRSLTAFDTVKWWYGCHHFSQPKKLFAFEVKRYCKNTEMNQSTLNYYLIYCSYAQMTLALKKFIVS